MSSPLGSYAALICDLDGVVYRGPSAVPFAVDALSGQDAPVLYATNNASRPPAEVAVHLRDLGLRAEASDVVNSSQAAAWLLGSRVDRGAWVLAVGGAGVAIALEEAGLSAIPRAEGRLVSAVVQGFGHEVTAAHLAEAAYAVEGGALWVATNTDLTLPTERGVAPGNGSLVAAVANAVGRGPDLVAGKPQTPIYELCADRLHLQPEDVLAVGDRLDTDVAGAVALGMDSLLVLTGVSDLDSVVLAAPSQRPTYVAPDLRCLASEQEAARVRELSAAMQGWWHRIDAGEPAADVLAGIDVEQILRQQQTGE